MKKVGVITLYRDNFGSILQAFATCSFIKSLGFESTILQYNFFETKLDKIKKIPSIIYRCLRYPDYIEDHRKVKSSIMKESTLLSTNTREKMNSFVNSVFSLEECSPQTLKGINFKYDYFITGSDQVWNGYDGFRFLTFANREKRIAYAPSFGSNRVKDYQRANVRRGLNGFDVLSTREESGVRIIKELTGKDAIRLSDPTLLLTKTEWDDFALQGDQSSNYILLHFLNKPNELALKTINEYLKKHDCAAYCICNKYEEYDQLMRNEFIDIDPYDYVSLISNANFVFTDSFHSTLFSLNLETQFLTFERQYLHGNSQSSRIVDLLKRVGMRNRFADINIDKQIFENFEHWNSDSIFKDERKTLIKYIERQVKKERNE